MKKNNSAILISGGLDSVSLLGKYFNEIINLIFIKYPAKSNIIEEDVVTKISNKYNKTLNIIELDFFREFESGLIDGIESDITSVSDNFIPYRNAFFILSAANICKINKIDTLYIGMNARRDGTLVYPDSTYMFLSSMQNLLDIYHKDEDYRLTLSAPYINVDKIEIYKNYRDFGFFDSDSISCINDSMNCGECFKCLERKRLKKMYENN